MSVVALACPRCRGEIAVSGDTARCSECGTDYPLVDGVPVLLPEELSKQHLHQRDYFDAEFSGYDEYTVENWRLSYIERIFATLKVLDGGAPYLDVGVGGSGATVIEAARRGLPAVGCDLSVPGVLAARRFAEQQGAADWSDFVVSAAESLPFPDASFGSASAVALLEHLDDDRPAAAEIARVVRPGGLVWLMVPHAFRYMPPPIWPFYWLHDRRIGHKRHYTAKGLATLAADVGLEHVRTMYTAHPVKVLQAVATKVFPGMREQGSPAWWRLERLDRRAERRAWGALHLSAVFRRTG
jgi:ubiquinone/menaquinone biosynthesis C-methylase UbiE